jgi:aspartate racemase
MNDLTSRIAALSPQQRALLEKQLQVKKGKSLELQVISRRPEGEFCPLSFGQEQLWFLDQMSPGSYTYNISASFHLSGPLSIALLERSFSEVLRRHEALRTSFPAVDGRPRQVVAPPPKFVLPKVDLREIPEPTRAKLLRRMLTELSQLPFDLGTGPLIRATLFQTSDAEHMLLMTLHHIIIDRWSYVLLWGELALLYETFSRGLPSPLKELPIQYADFALWQRRWLEGEMLESRLSYWRKKLAGAPLVLDLPTDRPRPPEQTFRGKRLYRVQPKALWSRLKALGREEHATLYMTLLAAYYVLLLKHTGREDLIVGTPFANRDRVETENLIGYLLNVLVLRVDASGDPTFRELLGRVRETATGAYANGELPFGRLVEELKPERDLSRNPIFQVTFVFVDHQGMDVNSPDLSQTKVDFDSGAAVVADLMLGVRDHSERPTLLMEYNVALFDDATVARMMAQYETLLESILARPDGRLSTLEMTTEAERERQQERKQEMRESRRSLLKNIQRKAIRVSE